MRRALATNVGIASTPASHVFTFDATTIRGERLSMIFPCYPKEIHMKRLTALMLLALFSMSFLSACNTMAGAGKDVQKVGEKVEDKAQDCKDGRC